MSLGLGEIIIVLVVAYVVVGPKDLPKVIYAIKKGLHQMRELTGCVQNSLKMETGIEGISKAVEPDTVVSELADDLKAIQDEIKSKFE